MNVAEPSTSVLEQLFAEGFARVPAAWRLTAPESAGYWWRSGLVAIATPLLLRTSDKLSSTAEKVGLLLATESRYRRRWLAIQGRRLQKLGAQGDITALCQQIDALGTAASAVDATLGGDTRGDAVETAVELSVLGAPAEQPAAAPALLRILAASAPAVEGHQATQPPQLDEISPTTPEANWVAGRLLQQPSASASTAHVLAGEASPCPGPVTPAGRMAWVLATPWAMLLGVLAFTAEAWASERQGGLSLELGEAYVQQFAHPPQVQVVVTLQDGREILCGTLGELCLRGLDALGMALVPGLDADELNRCLAPVIAELLRAQVWVWKPDARTHYVIGDQFSFDCYRGDGHRHICLGAERLSQTLRGVALNWAKARADGETRGERE